MLFSLYFALYVLMHSRLNIKFEISVMDASNMALQCLFPTLPGFRTVGLLNAENTDLFSHLINLIL